MGPWGKMLGSVSFAACAMAALASPSRAQGRPLGAVPPVAVAPPAAVAAPSAVALSAADRRSVAVTIYNNGIGLVREARAASLPGAGRARITYADVCPSIIAQSVVLAVAPKPDALRVLEQTYRYDLLSPEGLSRRADGATVAIHRVHPGTGEETAVRGRALAGFAPHEAPVVQTDDGITFYASRASLGFDKLPERWSSRPSLGWLVEVREKAAATLDVSYLARGMSWSADYVLTMPRAASDTATLVGWITLSNRSGAAFEAAKLAVVAGKVHMAEAPEPASGDAPRFRYAAKKMSLEPRARRQALGEYHLYEIPGATELPDRSSKQVTFLATTKLHVRTHYVAGHEYWRWQVQGRGATVLEAPEVELRFEVKESEGLGVPMPAGTVRVLTPDSAGRPQLVGQRDIGHTPRDETIKLRIGAASDLRLVRKLVSRAGIGKFRVDRVEYALRSAKPEQVVVEVLDRGGKLQSATLAATHPDAATTRFDVRVPPMGETRWAAEYTEER